VIHTKPDLRVCLKWWIAHSGWVITDVINTMSLFEQLIKQVIERNVSTGQNWYLSLRSKQSDDTWLDLSATSIQFRYPFSSQPEIKLAELTFPKGQLVVENWQQNSFVSFSFGESDKGMSNISRFVDQYIQLWFNECTTLEGWHISELKLME